MYRTILFWQKYFFLVKKILLDWLYIKDCIRSSHVTYIYKRVQITQYYNLLGLRFLILIKAILIFAILERLNDWTDITLNNKHYLKVSISLISFANADGVSPNFSAISCLSLEERFRFSGLVLAKKLIMGSLGIASILSSLLVHFLWNKNAR